MVRVTSVILILIFCGLSARFWRGNDSVAQVMKLKAKVQAQQKENLALTQRNQAIKQKIENLKRDPQSVEERARYELGMIKRGERFYQVVEPIE